MKNEQELLNQDVLNIKRFIHQVIPDEKEIIFFGSRARGEYRTESDYDILVIVHNPKIGRRQLIRSQAKIKRLCAKSGLDADLIVRDSSHADQMRKFPGNIIYSALNTGVYI